MTYGHAVCMQVEEGHDGEFLDATAATKDQKVIKTELKVRKMCLKCTDISVLHDIGIHDT